ncbi:MAG: hypothetical protein UX98_C0012G0014 [Parcubacteria group bacterium GW2011_GWA2_47_26]|nr:MAG: hypothetical protein UX98_C0012G0014 [Parcubacteria group bacterium GW2011_GWA2_47_26]
MKKIAVAVLVLMASSPVFALPVQYPLGNYAPGSFQGRVFGCCNPRHLGEDHAAEPLMPVYAIADGQIISSPISGAHCNFGMVIIIEHTLDDGNKFTSLYGHLSNRVGYRPRLTGIIRRGEIIGYVAHSGGVSPSGTRCRGPDDENGDGDSHLHFGIRLGPAPRDVRGNYVWLYPGYALRYGQDVDFDASGNPHGGLFTNPSRFLERLGVNDSDRDGYTVSAGDCDDTNPAINPGASEVCDGVDNNCADGIDENWRSIGAASLGNACTVGLGACLRTGAMVCTADHRATVCSADPGAPTAEVCDNLNNDCDCEGSDCRCGSPTRSCVCVGPRCTELIDEDFRAIGAASLGNSCTVGIGICVNTGIMVCTADHRATVCAAELLPPGLESCDGIDNDCDGRTDEDFYDIGVSSVGSSCTVGQGTCRNTGVMVCSTDRRSTVCGAEPLPRATAETCNRLDDDCDGATDEDFRDIGAASLGSSCTRGVGACATAGIMVCFTDGLSTVCNATPGIPASEVCNDRDDDCNGVVDDNPSCCAMTPCESGMICCGGLCRRWTCCTGYREHWDGDGYVREVCLGGSYSPCATDWQCMMYGGVATPQKCCGGLCYNGDCCSSFDCWSGLVCTYRWGVRNCQVP